MSVSNGQRANQTTFNAAFLSRTQDTDTTGRLKTAKWFTDGMADALTAHAGGGQLNAVQLAAGQNRVSVCATNGDSVKLPTAEAGQMIRVINSGAASLNIFPALGAQIDGAAANAAYALPAGSDILLLSRDLLQWVSVKGYTPDATAAIRGLVGITAQSFGGVKTFVDGLISTAEATFTGGFTSVARAIFQRFIAIQRFDDTSVGSITALACDYGFIRLTGVTAKTLHGVVAGVDGQRMVIHNFGAGDLTIKNDSATASAARRIICPGSTDITVNPKDSRVLVYDSSQSRWVFESNGSGAAGGGTAVQWYVNDNPPVQRFLYNFQQWIFGATMAQQLYTSIQVPSTYVAGKPIALKTIVLADGTTAGTVGFKAYVELTKGGTEAYSSAHANRTTTNAAFTNSGAVGTKWQATTLDLTDASGLVGGLAVAAGDFITVKLYRDAADTCVDDALLPDNASEVTFT